MNTNMNIMKINVKTAQGTFNKDLEQELKIDTNNIAASCIDQAPKYALWAVLAEQARSVADNLSNRITDKEEYISDTLPKELSIKIRKEYKYQTLSDKEVVNKIISHPEYLKNMQELNDLRSKFVNANLNASILESAKQAFKHRKNMLISLTKLSNSIVAM